MKKPKGFFTYFHHENVVNTLTDEQAGRLYKALLRYGRTGEDADLADDAGLNIAYVLLKGEIDYNFERYYEVCENRSRAALRREAKKRGEEYPDDLEYHASQTHNCDYSH